MSTKTGVACTITTALPDATNENDTAVNSAPGLTPTAFSAGTRRPAAGHIAGSARIRVHEPRQPRRGAGLQEAEALLLVEARTQARREVAEDGADLRVGVPEPQVVDIVPGIRAEAEVVVRLAHNLPPRALEGPRDRREVVGR